MGDAMMPDGTENAAQVAHISFSMSIIELGVIS